MEYRRRRRRRQKNSSDTTRGKIILAILLFSAIIYFASASSAGTWIAQNIIAPVIDAIGAGKDKDNNNDPDINEPSSTNTSDLSLEPLNCYMLQMGVYTSYDNADKEASAIKSQGAGGYIIKDGEKYRVIASGYEKEENAKEVCTRLVQSGMDCTVYKLNTDGAAFRVTASKEQLEHIKSSFDVLNQVQSKLSSEVIEFDKNQKSVAEEKSVLSPLLDSLKSASSNLSAYKNNETVAHIISAYDKCIDTLSNMINNDTESFVEFSSLLKYSHIQVTYEYSSLVDNLKGGGG